MSIHFILPRKAMRTEGEHPVCLFACLTYSQGGASAAPRKHQQQLSLCTEL